MPVYEFGHFLFIQIATLWLSALLITIDNRLQQVSNYPPRNRDVRLGVIRYTYSKLYSARPNYLVQKYGKLFLLHPQTGIKYFIYKTNQDADVFLASSG